MTFCKRFAATLTFKGKVTVGNARKNSDRVPDLLDTECFDWQAVGRLYKVGQSV